MIIKGIITKWATRTYQKNGVTKSMSTITIETRDDEFAKADVILADVFGDLNPALMRTDLEPQPILINFEVREYNGRLFQTAFAKLPTEFYIKKS